MKRYLLYKILNDINDKIYIGQTTESLKQRFSRHCGYQLNDNTYLHRAIRKYGPSHFSIYLIKEVDSQEALDQAEIDEINKYDRHQLYNLRFTKGKCGGDTLTDNPNLMKIKQKFPLVRWVVKILKLFQSLLVMLEPEKRLCSTRCRSALMH